MSDLNKYLKNILDPSKEMKFFVPVENNQALKYDTSFGELADFNIKTGLEITSSQQLNLKAAFKGQLFFMPSSIQSAQDGILRLRIAPTEALTIKMMTEEDIPTPIELVYFPVNIDKTKIAMKEVLKSQGISGNKLTELIDSFLTEDGIGIFVDSGQNIGGTEGNSLTLCFEDVNGVLLNPLYLLWLWRKFINPPEHEIIVKLDLNLLDLVLDNGIVTKKNNTGGEVMDFGEYSYVMP